MQHPERITDLLGEALERCHACGAESPHGARFCRCCGRAMATLEGPPGSPPGSHVQRAEHKQVTVLFADVQGSMALSERLDPEEWYRILVRFFVILADGVQRVGGVVNRFTGDGIMALFGAPVAQEDHAQRACYAALRLRRALASYATELRETRGVELAVRIGINSGDVVAATLGRDGTTSYTALGQTVHLAAAMERLAEPDRILVAERTASLVEGYFRLVDRGILTERGRAPAVRAYELVGLGSFHTRLERSRSHGLLRFVGRASEMRVLERGLEEARAKRGAIIGVRGEVGVGKSRLCQEFLTQCADEGVAVYDWRILSHLRATPFLSLMMDLRRLFAIRADVSSDTARQLIDAKLQAMGGSAAALGPFFERLLGVTGEARAGAEPSDDERLKLLIGGFMAALGNRRPALLLIEDLHWLDSASAKLLDLALASVAGTRVLVVLNFRPEYRAPRFESYRELSLAPLSRRTTHELLRQLLGDDPALDDLAGQIRARTGGNPFFMEELVTMLAETGALVGVRGAYAPGPNRERAPLPSSLQALLESRIDLLPARQKEVLQKAAVIGKTFSLALLRRVTALPGAELDSTIAALEEADFIAVCAPSGEVHYTFRHPLMQEQAYGVQVQDDLASKHADVARACIELYADRLDERASLVAHHWECAGDFLQAAFWGHRAATWIGQRNLGEALRRWRQVCALLDRAPSAPDVDTFGVLARSKLLELGARLGMSAEEARRLFAEARELATRAPKSPNVPLLYLAYAQARGFVGEHEEALALTREAVRLVGESGEPRLVLRVRVALIYGLLAGGHLRDALELTERLLARVGDNPQLGSDRHLAYLYLFHAMLCVAMGRPADSRADLARAADVAWQCADVEILAQIYGFEPVVTRMLGGNPSDCLAKAQRAVELAEYLGNPFARVFAYWALGNAHLLSGDGKTASKILNGVVLLARDHGVGVQGEAGMLAELACATLMRGEGTVALSITQEAVQVAQRCGPSLYECIAQLARAYILLETTGARAATEIEACLARVRTLVAADGTTSYAAIAHFHAATLAELCGDEARCRLELESARKLFAAMGSTGWLEKIDLRLQGRVGA